MRPTAILLCLLAPLGSPSAAGARERDEWPRPVCSVLLNGDPAKVAFNDGDSFEVRSGTLKGTKGRVGGFNALESHGPVHRWGNWNARELYQLADKATQNARRGGWHCTSELEKDGYGRILWDCPDLVADSLRKGLAHVYSVDAKPAARAVVVLQQEAKARGAGIWEKGVPEWVITSLHSDAEGVEGGAYNRLVSTTDGRSFKWKHSVSYGECEEVCQPPEPMGELKAPETPSCMTYVVFERRYGDRRAPCLRD